MKSLMKDFKKLLRYWGPVALWMGIIFLFSSFPTGSASQIVWSDFFLKKTAHLTEYGVLAILFYRALKNSGVKRERAALAAIIMVFVYGISDEIHQSFTPGRMPKWYDVGFDTIGGILAIFYIWKKLPLTQGKLKVWAEKLELN